MTNDPHAGQPVTEYGLPLGQSQTVVILLHGRGAGPDNILELAPLVGRNDITYLAPAAAGRTWYPNRFVAEIAANEPDLSSALAVVARLVSGAEAAGVLRSRIVLGGFSQGACLAAEFVIRHPFRYGGLAVFSGGAIGPSSTRWNTAGSLDGTPAFLGCSDQDAHIPLERVHQTADVLARLEASVTTRIYPGMGHTIIDDEIQWLRELVNGL